VLLLKHFAGYEETKQLFVANNFYLRWWRWQDPRCLL